MSDPFLGEIRMVGFNFNPQGWALCNGQLMSISQNSALFALLGVTFGGDGVQTFGLPDYRGRGAVGMGNGPNLTPIVQGELEGSENASILSTQLPAHTHTAAVTAATAAMSIAGTPVNQTTVPSAINSILGASPAGGPTSAALWSDALTNPVTLTNPTTVTATVTIGATGGSQPLPIRNPYLGTNFIIALQGIFPSRS
jgi:microcystin-dependent protein